MIVIETVGTHPALNLLDRQRLRAEAASAEKLNLLLNAALLKVQTASEALRRIADHEAQLPWPECARIAREAINTISQA